MIFKQIESGGDRNFAYIAACGKTLEGAVIDPSPDPRIVMDAAERERIIIKYVINTHSHFDHSAGNDYFREKDKKRQIVFINCAGLFEVRTQDIFNLGDIIFEIIPTPGHTKDSICVKIENKLITGDTLFVGKVGGTYGREDAEEEFESLREIISLPVKTQIWPGHDYGIKKSSTIGFEIENNPFIKRLSNFNDFLSLKNNWAEYKKEHGIK